MLSVKDVRALGEILNTSWGRTSGGSVSIEGSLQGESIILKLSTIVHFGSETSLRDQVRVLADESMQRIGNKLDTLKKGFKEKTGHVLKLDEYSNRDDVEIIQATAGSLRKIAYYRRFIVMNIL
jgi:hypothetical protein